MEPKKAREAVLEHLRAGTIAQIYANTYYSLLDRVSETGCFPESVGPGGYGAVMFCRTTGGIDALLRETGEYAADEKIIRFALDSARRMGLNRIPHIAHEIQTDAAGKVTQEFSTDDQADGELHVILAYARLVLSGRASKDFEDAYYPDVKAYLDKLMRQPYFYYEEHCPVDVYPFMFPPESLKLIFNCALEHSRENRRWSVFDLLTQSFGGAALEAMAGVAEKRGDGESAAFWRGRLRLLTEGIDRYMTREIDGKKVYLEMRIPDGGWGRPFTGMSWINFSPVAAGWQGLPPEVLDHTIEYIRRKIWREAPYTNGRYYMATEFNEDGGVNPNILGKVIGWDLAYSARKEDYAHILSWIEFLEEVNRCDLLAENLSPADGEWKIADGGNGEQCSWWCWGMAVLRASLGLPPAPERPAGGNPPALGSN